MGFVLTVQHIVHCSTSVSSSSTSQPCSNKAFGDGRQEEGQHLDRLQPVGRGDRGDTALTFTTPFCLVLLNRHLPLHLLRSAAARRRVKAGSGRVMPRHLPPLHHHHPLLQSRQSSAGNVLTSTRGPGRHLHVDTCLGNSRSESVTCWLLSLS